MKKYCYALQVSFRLCFNSSKAMTLGYVFIKILLTVLPSLQILLLSKLINQIESSSSTLDDIFNRNLYFLIFVIMLIWLCKSTQLSILECLKIKIKEVVSPIFTKKRTNLCLDTLENEKENEMIHRVCSEIEVNICDAFEATLGLIAFLFQVSAILLVLMQQVGWIAIFVLLISLPLIPITIKNSAHKYEQDMKVTKLRRQYEYLSDCITSREEAQEREIFHTNQFLSDQWAEKFTEARIIKNCNEKKWYKKVQGSSFVTQLFFMIIILILGIYTRLGYLSVGIFIAFIPTSFDLVLIASWDLHDFINKSVTAKEYFQEYQKFLRLREFNDQGKTMIDRIDEIELRDVSFKYPNSEKEIIQHCSTCFQRSQRYFLIGLNGAGKSTIIKLILGFYDTYEGTILVNGIDLKTIDFRCIYEKMSVMFQDFVRFHVNAKTSLFLGSQREYNLHDDFILQESWIKEALASDKVLGKEYCNGIGLSGGQWQKVSILRTILKRCDVKIFDEPTAFIDPIEESRLIDIMKESCTLGIFITHRLSLIGEKDQVIVLKDGCVVENGSKKELLDKESYFKNLYETQGSWYQ